MWHAFLLFTNQVKAGQVDLLTTIPTHKSHFFSLLLNRCKTDLVPRFPSGGTLKQSLPLNCSISSMDCHLLQSSTTDIPQEEVRPPEVRLHPWKLALG